MNDLKLIVFFLLSIAYTSRAQQHTNLESIGNFNEGLMAISNGDSWGFIDKSGSIVIDFRKDIVATYKEPPVFKNGLCLIKEEREDVVYYGYMNTKGKTIINPEYIVAKAFENGFARVINYYKTNTGTNVFDQNVVYYSYNELIINTENTSVLYIGAPHKLLLNKLKAQQNIPVINSKFINDHLISVKEDDNTYSIYNLNK
ncbi:WG repeat-containing protein [Polaribacter sp. IC073]|uniref:WG repeat-containing protein n=1 Tax=Polaribacter sp. IC073 TaxID=2508540 RepID=UPI0011BE5C75|nr:WG repeat-containing protein [Polaribacter sp. IC073]TXD48659.1 WG repeat-containing protein [Polaribacter sp. IC073]